MKFLSSNEIRQLWIDFFKSKKHFFMESASLVPINDKSLLWINSGVATLKKFFSGEDTPPAKRIVNSQKVLRTNDIINIGKTSRHHTFFEMLGNFSIGDYFKKEAIAWAWEFLTSEKYLNINPEKLYITIYEKDDESYNLWKKYQKKYPNHILKCSRETNFWDMGQGPCGPNTEIFYDRGEKFHQEGPELIIKDIENDRFIEIWNIVFSQFNNDGQGNYSSLPQKNIDTGAGFERIVAISQNAPTNFESDLFLDLIKILEPLCLNKKYYIDNYFMPIEEQTAINCSYKVIVDHIRAIVFAISDGVVPSNKDRGYVLRKLIRKAIINGIYLDINKPFLAVFVKPIVKKMGNFFHNLKTAENQIIKIIIEEEKKFFNVLKKSQKLFFEILDCKKTLSAIDAFKLYDTYGLPIDFIEDLCVNYNVILDKEEFNNLYNKHINLSKSASKFTTALSQQSEITKSLKKLNNNFLGYNLLEIEAKCIFIFADNKILTNTKNTTGNIFAIFDNTPFYAESGGQIFDIGIISSLNMQSIFKVVSVKKSVNNLHIHELEIVKGNLNISQKYLLSCDKLNRELVANNHSATHLLNAALAEILKEQVFQAGSFIDANSLRFDFSTTKKINNDIIIKVNKLVNKWIHTNCDKEEHQLNINEAKKSNITMNFEEKYGEIVRVIKYGDYSKELCGGTHVNNLKNIEQFEIIHFENKGSGIYRIEALTTKNTILKYYEKLNSEMKTTLIPAFKNLSSVKISQSQNEKNSQSLIPIVANTLNQNIIKLPIIHLLQKQLQKNIKSLKNSELLFLINFYLLQLNIDSYEAISRLLMNAHLLSNEKFSKKYEGLLSYLYINFQNKQLYNRSSLTNEFNFLSYFYILTYKFNDNDNYQDFLEVSKDFINKFSFEENSFLYQFLYQTNPKTYEHFSEFKKLLNLFQTNTKQILLKHSNQSSQIIASNLFKEIEKQILKNLNEKLIIKKVESNITINIMRKVLASLVKKYPNYLFFIINSEKLFALETSLENAKKIKLNDKFIKFLKAYQGNGGGKNNIYQGKIKKLALTKDIFNVFKW